MGFVNLMNMEEIFGKIIDPSHYKGMGVYGLQQSDRLNAVLMHQLTITEVQLK